LAKTILIPVAVIAILPLIFLFGIFDSPEPKSPNSIDYISFGIIPLEDDVITSKNFQNTLSLLEQDTGLNVQPFVTSSYEGIIDGMNNDFVDVALLGGHSFVLGISRGDSIEVFATGVRSDTQSSTYQSIIISNKDSNLQSIQDIAERKSDMTFAFVDRASTSGYLMPMEAFTELSIDPFDEFDDAIFFGRHDKIVNSVQSGEVLAGATSTITYDRMVNEGLIDPQKITVMWKSEKIQGLPFVMRSDLSEDLKEKIRNSFYNMHKHDLSDGYLGGWGNIISYAPVSEDDYQYAFRASKAIGDI